MSEFANKLLDRVKLTLRESSDDFNDDIKADIDASAMDLMQAGILSYFFQAASSDWEVDPLILRAVKWYCLSVYGLYNTDMEKYDTAYRSLKATLATQARYRRNQDDPLKDAEIQHLYDLIFKLDSRLSEVEIVDEFLSSTSIHALQNKVITENFVRVDNEFIQVKQRADTIEEIAKGAVVAKSYLTYSDMVADLNFEKKSKYNVGQHFIIQTVGVPDLYVYDISNNSVKYTYTNDNAIVSATENGYLQIGYYQISQLETQKADLTEYAKKDQVPVINTTLKSNGAYTLTITMGVE